MTMLGQEKPSLGDLTHHGVKGMKWGVRKNYQEIRNAPTAHHEFTTSKGKRVSLDENRNPAIGSAIAAISPRFRNAMSKSKSFTISADSKKVGNAQFHEVSKDELNLVWLGVNKDQRGKGYASAVFESGVEYGKQNGYKALTLEVPGNAPDAQHIYAKNGFKVSGPTEGNAKSDPMWGGLTPMSYNIENPNKVYSHVVHSVFDADEAALEKAIQDTFPDDVLTNPEKYAASATHEQGGIQMTMLGQEKPSLGDLTHHGVKGMKWGVRRDPQAHLQRVSESAALKATRRQNNATVRDAAKKATVRNPTTADIMKARRSMPQSHDRAAAARANYKVSKAQYRIDKEKIGKTQAKIALENNGKLPLRVAKAQHQAQYDLANKETTGEVVTRVITDLLSPRPPRA